MDIEVPMVKYSVMAPTSSFEGDIEELALYAGMSVSLVREKLPAGEIVRRIAAEAQRGHCGTPRIDGAMTWLLAFGQPNPESFKVDRMCSKNRRLGSYECRAHRA